MLDGRSAAVLGALLVVVVVAGIAIATQGRASRSGTATLAPLARAAYATTQAPGFKFELTVTGSVGAQNFAFGGEGSIDERDLEGTMSTQVDGKTVPEIIKKPYVYISAPSGSSPAVADGKPWLRANLDTYMESLGASNPFGANTTGPTQLLGLLRASGSVSTLGEQSVHGVATTHYRTLVDFSRYASMLTSKPRAAAEQYANELKRMTGSSSLSVDVWVDAQQRVRRFSTQLQVCTPQGKLTESFAMDLYDYGRQPAVLAPAESEVTDITSQLASQGSQALQQLSC